MDEAVAYVASAALPCLAAQVIPQVPESGDFSAIA